MPLPGTVDAISLSPEMSAQKTGVAALERTLEPAMWVTSPVYTDPSSAPAAYRVPNANHREMKYGNKIFML